MNKKNIIDKKKIEFVMIPSLEERRDDTLDRFLDSLNRKLKLYLNLSEFYNSILNYQIERAKEEAREIVDSRCKIVIERVINRMEKRLENQTIEEKQRKQKQTKEKKEKEVKNEIESELIAVRMEERRRAEKEERRKRAERRRIAERRKAERRRKGSLDNRSNGYLNFIDNIYGKFLNFCSSTLKLFFLLFIIAFVTVCVKHVILGRDVEHQEPNSKLEKKVNQKQNKVRNSYLYDLIHKK